MIYAFGDFELDDRLYELRRGTEVVSVEPKALDLLVYLMRNRDRLVSKQELQDHLWSGRIVGETSLSRCVSLARQAVCDDAADPTIIQTVYARGFRFIAPVCERGASGIGGSIRSLAVLPLENLSGDPEQEYFADGLTELLIGELARIGSLRVISRTSVMAYKGARKPLPEIARELDVDAVIEGSTVRDGDRVRITVQLIDARTDDHLWSERYDRGLRDALSLESAIAHAVAERIQLELTPQEQVLLQQTRPVDPAALDAYLRGIGHWSAQPPEHLEAIECFERAVKLEPTDAVAWTWLAAAHVRRGLSVRQPLHRDVALPKAREAALEACRLDPTLGRARAWLGMVALFYDLDWSGAERAFRRAVELSPHDSLALSSCGFYSSFVGRHDEAIAFHQRATRVAPGDLATWLGHAESLYTARRYHEALRAYERVVELEPERIPIHLGLTYRRLGRDDDADREAARSLGGKLGEGVRKARARARAEGRDANRAATEALLEQVSRGRYFSPYLLGEIFVSNGETDLAFEWLERACRERDPFVLYLGVSPELDSLRSDPRFDDLLRRIRWPGL